MTKNETDQLPAETIHHRASFYSRMMSIGYVWFLPAVLAIVMFIGLLLRDVNGFTALVIAFFTWLGVLGLSKTFFVH
ncbi:MAG: hypothetical protein V2I43_22900 [Parvularcula sp.]|nr:hypothetical protein [Parvularcula sp.]